MNTTTDKTNQPFYLSRWLLLASGIIILGAFLRLHVLDYMAFHHDESIHAYYSYNLWKTGNYTYDPVYHGPILYQLGNLFFFLFGDTDFTARLPYIVVGLINLLMVLCLYRFVGDRNALWSALFVSLSASLVYFSRFARHDVYHTTWLMGIIFFFMAYLQTRRVGSFWSMCAFIALLYATKEDSTILLGMMMFFLLVWMTVRVLQTLDGSHLLFEMTYTYGPLTMLYGLLGAFVVGTFGFSFIPVWIVIDWGRYTGDLDINVTRQELYHWYAQNSVFVVGWIGFWVLFALGWVAGVFWFGSRTLKAHTQRSSTLAVAHEDLHAPPRSLWWYYGGTVGVGVLIMVIIHVLLFTNFFRSQPVSVDYTSPGGETTITYTASSLWVSLVDYFAYWINMQHRPRIKNVWNYHINRMLLYETGVLLLAIAATVAYCVIKPAQVWIAGQIWQSGTVWRMFLVFWTWVSVAFYAYANEKVPWLLYEQMLPICLLAGVFVADVYRVLNTRWARRVWTGVIVLFCVWSLRNTILLCFYNSDDPREAMVFVQSSHHCVEIVQEIEQLRHRLALPAEQTAIHVQDDCSWPFSWYLRRYKTSAGPVRSGEAPIILCGPGAGARAAQQLRATHIERRYPMRQWWNPPEGSWRQGNWRENLWNYAIYRTTWTNTGGSDLLMFIRRDLVGAAPTEELTTLVRAEDAPIPEGYDQPTQPVQIAQVFGASGAGTNQLRHPRDCAVGPDGKLYVADLGNNRVAVFNPDGSWDRAIAEGQLERPNGICVDASGVVYVADTWNHRVVVYTPTGELVRTIRPTGERKLFGPRGVAVNSQRNQIYITDTGNKRVAVYNTDGLYLTEWGFHGEMPGQFEEPVGIATDEQNRVYVADTANRRVQVFDSRNRFASQWSVDGWTEFHTEPYIEVAPDGAVWVTDAPANLVHRFAELGKQVTTYGKTDDNPDPFIQPKGIAVGADGAVYVTDTSRDRIIKFIP